MDSVWRRKSAMNCVRWSMGDAALHGIGTSSVPASLSGVTHVPGLNCYLCVRTVPRVRRTSRFSGPPLALLAPAAERQRSPHRRSDSPLRAHTVIAVLILLPALLAAPLAADAQQAGKVPRVGFLSLTSPSDRAPLLDAFRQRLRELGWVEGENIVIDYRYAEGRVDRL